MSVVALVVGYAVLALAAMAALFFGGLFLIAWFPLRFQWTIKPPSYIKTPNQIQNIDALVGISNRGGGRMWFVGLLTVSPGVEPRIRPSGKPYAPISGENKKRSPQGVDRD